MSADAPKSLSKVRPAVPSDLPKLAVLKQTMVYPATLFYDRQSWYQAGVQRLREFFAITDELSDWRLLVLVEGEEEEPRGYLLLMVDDKHGVTHQLQSLLTDYAVFSFDHLHKLTARARKIVTAFENEYLVVDLGAAERKLQMWFYRCGFRAEQQRVAKFIAAGHQGAINSAFRLRAAGPADLTFILETHAAYSHAYLPAGRDVNLDELEFHYQLTYLALDLSGEDGSVYSIMEEISTGIPAGYIFLKRGPIYGTTKSLYIYDVAVAPAFAGRGLSVHLRGAAESLAGQTEGGAIVYGDGTLGTAVIGSWHRQMGYEVDSLRFALDCRPLVEGEI